VTPAGPAGGGGGSRALGVLLKEVWGKKPGRSGGGAKRHIISLNRRHEVAKGEQMRITVLHLEVKRRMLGYEVTFGATGCRPCR